MDKYERWKLHNPEFRYSGPAPLEQVIDEEIEQLEIEKTFDTSDFTDRLQDGAVVLRMPGLPGVKVGSFRMTEGPVTPGQPFFFKMLLDVEPGRYNCIYLLTLWRKQEMTKVRCMSPVDRFEETVPTVRPVYVDFSPFLLLNGHFWLTISIYEEKVGGGCGERYDMLSRCAEIDVLSSDNSARFIHPATWTISEIGREAG